MFHRVDLLGNRIVNFCFQLARVMVKLGFKFQITQFLQEIRVADVP